ncbi:glycerophosphodiester phosphodiesterase [Neobacillus mesonae]|uniref:glycerophosphodiester phosphodiesterase n=1 Tax=Neobacillus mesonae TaxID=1193713 RepID=UPI00203CF014|nr:glycerophosphodiester phosphodiesterase [Neobacillus mesonae]MCM3569925.1 glycerophosphodiester phosphodiesterase [Neobacillus mesonae]
MTKIYGHRGAKGSYPENTLLSFKKAIDQGVDGLELDVHLTKDGEVVVIHDETLDRTTNGIGEIRELTLEEIKQVSAGSPFAHLPDYHEAWELEKVPTLQEVLELMAPYPTELNIELKTYAASYKGIEEKVQSIVEKCGNDRKVVYSSFHLPSLLRMKKVNPEAHIAWLLNEEISLPADYIETLDFEALHLNKKIILSKKVGHSIRKTLHEDNTMSLKGLYEQVRVWTVNDPDQIGRLLELQVNAIITDFPERAIALRNKREAMV